MGRPKDTEFWNYIERIEGGLKCIFCNKVFKGSPSISRFKSHLSGLSNRDILPCKRVPHHVKEKALTVVQGTNKKRRTTMPSLSTMEDSPTIPLQLTKEAGKAAMPMEIEDIGDEFWEHRTSTQAEVPNGKENNVGQCLQPVKTLGDELLTVDRLIGEQFNSYLEEVMEWLMDDDVSIIGIYGMVGVGKTELAKHINNQLLITPTIFHRVYWVTVSPDLSIHKLQNKIAKFVNLDILDFDDENIRAAKLKRALMENKKFVLILDDVWNYIPLNMVGIPVDKEGCKLVLTTTSLDVCRQMLCQKDLEVQPFEYVGEAWELFIKELRCQSELSPEIKEIAKSFVNECDGLPLVIEIIARNMRGMNDICEWRNALQNFKGGIQTLQNKEVFLKLRRCYDNLKDPSLQQCFLYCALFPKSYELYRNTLIHNLIDEGIIKGKKSRQEEIDEGHHMLNRLINLCFLYEYEYLGMHSLLRQMAFHIMQESSPALVEWGKETLDELPDKESWTQDLVRVSLIGNEIEEIHPNHEPSCPNLLTLLLCESSKLRSIPDSFFKQLHRLQVLDLSNSAIEELPYSLSRLGSLSALLLSHCKKLRQVPPLGELTMLKKLDLNFSGVEIVPRGMESLSNLRYLGLMGTKLKHSPPGILLKLCRLQVLLLSPWSLTTKAEEITCFRKLETLMCHLYNDEEFNKFTTSLKGNQHLRSYLLQVGEEERDDYDYVNYCDHIYDYDFLETKKVGLRKIKFYNCSISSREDSIFLPENIKSLEMKHCNVRRRFMFEEATNLDSFEAWNCDGIEVLLSFFPNSSEGNLQPVTLNDHTFSRITKVFIYDCQGLKKLFPCWLLSNLQNLKSISVQNCANLEEIITQYNKSDVQSFCLPKLESLYLIKLPELKTIFDRELKCNSLEQLKLINCEKLQRIPFSLLWLKENEEPSPLPSLKEITVRPKEWWEGLQWDHPRTATILIPLCRFWSIYF